MEFNDRCAVQSVFTIDEVELFNQVQSGTKSYTLEPYPLKSFTLQGQHFGWLSLFLDTPCAVYRLQSTA